MQSEGLMTGERGTRTWQGACAARREGRSRSYGKICGSQSCTEGAPPESAAAREDRRGGAAAREWQRNAQYAQEEGQHEHHNCRYGRHEPPLRAQLPQPVARWRPHDLARTTALPARRALAQLVLAIGRCCRCSGYVERVFGRCHCGGAGAREDGSGARSCQLSGSYVSGRDSHFLPRNGVYRAQKLKQSRGAVVSHCGTTCEGCAKVAPSFRLLPSAWNINVESDLRARDECSG